MTVNAMYGYTHAIYDGSCKICLDYNIGWQTIYDSIHATQYMTVHATYVWHKIDEEQIMHANFHTIDDCTSNILMHAFSKTVHAMYE